MAKRMSERVYTTKSKFKIVRLAPVFLCFIFAGCVSSTATIDGNNITVHSEGLSLLYSYDRLVARSDMYAWEVCRMEKGTGITLKTKPGINFLNAGTIIGAGKSTVESGLLMSLFDQVPTYSVTREPLAKL